MSFRSVWQEMFLRTVKDDRNNGTADPADRPVAGAFIVRDRNPDWTDLRVSDRKSADAGHHGKSG